LNIKVEHHVKKDTSTENMSHMKMFIIFTIFR